VPITPAFSSLTSVPTTLAGHNITLTSGNVTTALGYVPTSVASLTGAQTVAAFKTGLSLVKADVGLGSVDNTADAAKNVLSATKLTTARNINGVAFDGTGNITINAVDATAREPAIAAGTISQYWRGDKSWQTLDKTAVGLGSAENKSSSTIRGEITSLNVTTALGFTPYNIANTLIVQGGTYVQYSGGEGYLYGFSGGFKPMNLGGVPLRFQYGSSTIGEFGTSGFLPGADNSYDLGSGTLRWRTVYAATGAINTSDERAKQDIGAIPDEWLDAWGDVEWGRFRFVEAVAEKGDDARWHLGLVAQRVRRAFRNRGLNARQIGLLCFDQWGPRVERQPVYSEEGRLLVEAQPARKAGNRWGLRYDECFAMEAAWQRREISRLRSMILPTAI
jgi:hypothetical protein